MFTKIDLYLEFKKNRNRNLITPCCNKKNTDGKYVNYKGFSEQYGYCHSCGKASPPPCLYKDEKGEEFTWNDTLKRFESVVLQNGKTKVSQLYYRQNKGCNQGVKPKNKVIKFVSNDLLSVYYSVNPKNNLINYLLATYDVKKVNFVLQVYYIGTSKDGGCVFWSINEKGNIQKAKVSYYKPNGRRTNQFKVPYKNEDGYYSCLFGLHLINLPEHIDKPIVLVESEKTAIICALHIPEYVWLAYGGINGLTSDKLIVLTDRKVILVPDISSNAVAIMTKKVQELQQLGVDVKLWDMTNGKSDEQLKKEGWYNCDLEDVFRHFSN